MAHGLAQSPSQPMPAPAASAPSPLGWPQAGFAVARRSTGHVRRRNCAPSARPTAGPILPARPDGPFPLLHITGVRLWFRSVKQTSRVGPRPCRGRQQVTQASSAAFKAREQLGVFPREAPSAARRGRLWLSCAGGEGRPLSASARRTCSMSVALSPMEPERRQRRSPPAITTSRTGTA